MTSPDTVETTNAPLTAKQLNAAIAMAYECANPETIKTIVKPTTVYSSTANPVLDESEVNAVVAQGRAKSAYLLRRNRLSSALHSIFNQDAPLPETVADLEALVDPKRTKCKEVKALFSEDEHGIYGEALQAVRDYYSQAANKIVAAAKRANANTDDITVAQINRARLGIEYTTTQLPTVLDEYLRSTSLPEDQATALHGFIVEPVWRREGGIIKDVDTIKQSMRHAFYRLLFAANCRETKQIQLPETLDILHDRIQIERGRNYGLINDDRKYSADGPYIENEVLNGFVDCLVEGVIRPLATDAGVESQAISPHAPTPQREQPYVLLKGFVKRWMDSDISFKHQAWLTTAGKITPSHFQSALAALPNTITLPDEGVQQTVADIYNTAMQGFARPATNTRQNYLQFVTAMEGFEAKMRSGETLVEHPEWSALGLDDAQREAIVNICADFRKNSVLNHFKASIEKDTGSPNR